MNGKKSVLVDWVFEMMAAKSHGKSKHLTTAKSHGKTKQWLNKFCHQTL